MKFDLEQEKGPYLYHYTTMEIAQAFILPHMRLRYNPIIRSNDPRESQKLGFGGMNGNFRKGYEIDDQKDWNGRISDKLREGCKTICFSQDYFVEEEWWDGYNLSRMWAQYGDRHRGICLMIDREKFIQENTANFQSDSHYFKEVRYTNKNDYPFVIYDRLRSEGFDNYVDDFKRSNCDYLYFQKHLDWQAEHEVRCVLFSKASGDEYCTIRNSICGVIVGIDFPTGALHGLHALMGEAIYRVQLDGGCLKAIQFRKQYLEAL